MKTIIIEIIKKYWHVLVLMILIGIIFLMAGSLHKNKIEIERKTRNIEVLNSRARMFEVMYNTGLNTLCGKDSLVKLHATKVEALSYTLAEYKQYREEDLKVIESLKIKLKQVISVTNVGTSTEQTITTPTIHTDTAACFNYEDKYLKLSGCTKKDSTTVSYRTHDDLTIIPTFIPKHKFLWWTWGVRGVELNVISKNPNTSFNYNQYYEIKK